MKVEDIVKGVLDQYVGTQLNIDSEAARDILSKHIAERLKYVDTQEDEFWKNLDQGQYYNKHD
jgi:hypothetical protein